MELLGKYKMQQRVQVKTCSMLLVSCLMIFGCGGSGPDGPLKGKDVQTTEQAGTYACSERCAACSGRCESDYNACTATCPDAWDPSLCWASCTDGYNRCSVHCFLVVCDCYA
jgi:hypothetical protein